jgi:cobalt-zinc-cadmium efflux system protein
LKFRNLKFSAIILLNIVIVLAEIYYGYLSNSIALITDALHNFGDIIAVIISFVASVYGGRSATITNTFGYIRAEMMATFINSLMLILVMVYVLYESIEALLFNSGAVSGETMMIVATIALVANGISAYILLSMKRDKEDVNIHSAYLHFLADSLLSLSVILGGVAIYYFQIYIIDKILGLLFGIYIIYSTFPLLKRSFYSLMDIEHSIHASEVEAMICQLDGVRSLHDVHIIEPSPNHSFFYGHLVLEENLRTSEVDTILKDIKRRLKAFGINHSVIQPEGPENRDEPLLKQDYIDR